MLTCSHSSANSSEAMKARTSRSTRLLIAADRGPTSCSSRGLSVITPSKTLLRTASMSTCFSMAAVTLVAMASCTSGESINGSTVATYRSVSFRVR